MDTAYSDAMMDSRGETLAHEENWARFDDRGDRFTMADVTDVAEACNALIANAGQLPVGVDARIFDGEERAQIAQELGRHGITLVQAETECHCDGADHFERIPVLFGVSR